MTEISELNGLVELLDTKRRLEFVSFSICFCNKFNLFLDLGPPQLSAKFKNRRDDRDRRDRDDRRNDYRRPDPRDQPRDYRDSREYYDRYAYRAPPAAYDRVPAYRDDRYLDSRPDDMYRRDPRYDVRAPPLVPQVYDARRSPPRSAEYRSRSPVVAGDRK